MSAPRELNHTNDFVILTVDVADSPIAELRLSEIYDVETSTMKDDYLLVLQDYIALQLEDTVGLGDRFKFRLLDSCFIPLHCRANGDVVSLRKPAMERLIRQTLQSRLDTRSSISVSILIKFKTPGFRVPRRLNESLRIPPKIGDIASTSIFGGSHSMLDKEWVCEHISDLNVEPVTCHVDFTHNNQHVVTGMAKDGMEHSDSSPLIRFQDLNDDDPLAATSDFGVTCNLVADNFIPYGVSRSPTELCDNVVDTERGDLNARKGNLSTIPLLQVKSNNCKHPHHVHMAIGAFLPVVVKCSHALWMPNATKMRQLCRSMLMMYRPIDRGRQLQRPVHC
jgi:hypothetical protein